MPVLDLPGSSHARRAAAVAVTVAAVAMVGPMPHSQAAAGAPSKAKAARTGVVQIIQAVPKASVRVTIDGRQVDANARLGAILGPYSIAAGKHDVRFVDPSGKVSMSAKLTVASGTSTDVVLHRPASVSGEPVVNVYHTPRKPIGPGKARVLIAHTATVAPADVRVDGKVVFSNIANGEYANADVPAGQHKVALLPAGQKTHPILGPLSIDLKAQTVTMVYAVGRPSNGSMKVIAHTAQIASDGTVEPDTIATGTAGLAAGARVTTFGAPARSSVPASAAAGLRVPSWWWAPTGVLMLCVTRRIRAARARVSTAGV
jgi:hypothetical protein